MANFGIRSAKDQLAVENLLSQAHDLYVLEQVAAINLSGFADSSLPSNLETRFRRLKSLPDPVSSSSSNKKLLEKTNFSRNLPNPSIRRFGNLSDSGRIGSSSCRFSQESRVFPSDDKRIKRNPSVNSSKSGSSTSSCRFSRESKIFEKPRFSLSSFTSVDLSDPKPEALNRESKPKSKSKLLSLSWFNKLSPAQAMGCIWRPPIKSTTTTKTSKNMLLSKRDRDADFEKLMSEFGEFSVEEQRRMLKNAITETQRMRREAAQNHQNRKLNV